MANYTNQAAIEAILARSLTSWEVAQLDTLLGSIDAYINSEIDSAWGSLDPETRYYNGNGSSIIDIDPCHDITKVSGVDRVEVEDNDYIENSDYEAFPRSSEIKTWLQFRGMYLPYGVGNIAVTATFNLGTSAPADIQYLAAYLATQMLSQVNGSTLNLKSESIEGYSRTFRDTSEIDFSTDKVVTGILDKYKSNSLVF